MKVSVVVPTLDEEDTIAEALAAAAEADELVVVDGGSSDRTCEIARSCGARVVTAARGRGRQLRHGAAVTHGEILLFLHADTQLPAGFRDEIAVALARGPAVWGRFDLRFDYGGPLLHLIARLISIRSRLTRVATGDQAIFVRRDVLERSGGVCEEPIFEDVDLCRRLRRAGAMLVPSRCAITSARRWRARGAWKTSFLMWSLKLAYLAGVPPERLARFYDDVR